MKLIKVTKNGSLHFELADGRLGVTYESGYVRVSTKRSIEMSGKLYQINKQEFEDKTQPYPGTEVPNKSTSRLGVKRVLIPNHVDRINHLMSFNNNNCK